MTAKEQNKVAGILLLAHGGIQAAVMLLLGLIYGGVGAALFFGAQKQEEQFVGLAFIGIILVLAFFSLIFVVPQFVGGWKMLKERPNARTWGIIGSVISCISFPLGTIAGVFGLVFLLGDGGKEFYLEGGNRQIANLPPPPHSWQ
jgi:hypothetical protein